MTTPSPSEADAAMERCRELLLRPTYWERHAGSDEFERRIAANAAGQRAFFLDLLEQVRHAPDARSRQPLPHHLRGLGVEAGCTMLFLLADTTRIELSDKVAEGMAAMLLRAGADPLLHGGPQGRHPLHTAMLHPGIARLLLKAGADPNVRDDAGRTPLFHVCRTAALDLLLEHGADVAARDAARATALHRALALVWTQPLVEHGADVNAQDEQGRTPIFHVMDEETARYLVEHGADPLHRDKRGRNALFQYAMSRELVRYLVGLGCDPNAQDTRGRTPLHATACAATAEELIACGADPKVRDAQGRTPLEVACHERVAAALRAGMG